MMIMDWMQQWAGIAFSVINLLFVWIMWSLGRRFASRESLMPFERRLDGCEKILEKLQVSLSQQPGQREIERLQQSNTAIEIKLARIDATVRKLDETTRRLSDYLLNRGGQ